MPTAATNAQTEFFSSDGEPPYFHRVDTWTANWSPSMPDEAGFILAEFETTDPDLEDVRAGVEVENIYDIRGRSAFKRYEEYRQTRLGQRV